MLVLVAFLQLTMPIDSTALNQAADFAGLPHDVIYAVAWMESRSGSRGNAYRGPGREVCDSIGQCHKACREIGRMQVNPCIHWPAPYCARDSLKVYWSNVKCGAAILHWRYATTGSWPAAIRTYNGGGKKADDYLERALAYIGWLALRKVDVM